MKFATCLNCMDGRVQEPVISWIKSNYKVDFVDMITEAGMDGFLVNSANDIGGILEKINISFEKHGSDTVFIVGHYDCGGNSVDEKTHKDQITASVKNMKILKPKANIFGLWVSSEWKVEKVM